MAIEIVSFPMKNGGSFHCYVSLPEGNGTELGTFHGIFMDYHGIIWDIYISNHHKGTVVAPDPPSVTPKGMAVASKKDKPVTMKKMICSMWKYNSAGALHSVLFRNKISLYFETSYGICWSHEIETLPPM
jgi:hypothetical protein